MEAAAPATPPAAPVTNGSTAKAQPPAPEIEAPKPPTKDVVAEVAPEDFFRDKVKVYGKERDVAFKSKDELRTELQKLYAAKEKIGEATKEQDLARKIIEMGRNDFEGLAKHLGYDLDQIAQQRLAAVARHAMMTEEERKFADVESERDQLKQKLEEHDKTTKQKEVERLAEKIRGDMDSTFSEAMNKVGLEKNYETLYLMAETAKQALEDRIEYSSAELAKETQRRVRQFSSNYLSKVSDDSLLSELGDPFIERVVTARLKKVQAQSPSFAKKEPKVERANDNDKPQEFIDESEVNRRLRSFLK